MKEGQTTRIACAFAILLFAAASAPAQTLLGSEFTYQAQLKLAGQVLNDTADFEFTLWDADAAGNMIGSVVPVSNVTDIEGLFTVEIDFGVLAFNGEARWLEIDVRSPAGGGEFTTLSPRQPLTSVPYTLALHALGTEQDPNGPNVIAGHTANSVAASRFAVAIACGGRAIAPNLITDNAGMIGGDVGNTSGNSGTVGGGVGNTASGIYATVPGALRNTTAGGSSFAAGRNANANHDGTFVWADSTDAEDGADQRARDDRCDHSAEDRIFVGMRDGCRQSYHDRGRNRRQLVQVERPRPERLAEQQKHGGNHDQPAAGTEQAAEASPLRRPVRDQAQESLSFR